MKCSLLSQEKFSVPSRRALGFVDVDCKWEAQCPSRVKFPASLAEPKYGVSLGKGGQVQTDGHEEGSRFIRLHLPGPALDL